MASISNTTTPPHTYPPSHARPAADVLLLGWETTTAKLAQILRGSCRVVVSSTAFTARAFLSAECVGSAV